MNSYITVEIHLCVVNLLHICLMCVYDMAPDEIYLTHEMG